MRSLGVFAFIIAFAIPGIIRPAGGALASRLFVGDFETGNFSQWSRCQNAEIGSNSCDSPQFGHSMQVEDKVVRQGKFAARFEVREGDHPQGMCCGDRAEVLGAAAEENEGDDLWYQWSSYFADGFPASEGWYVVSQWHARRDGVPPISLGRVADGLWGLVIQTWDGPESMGALFKPWATPVVTGVWTDLKFHIGWSASDDFGFVEMWVNGVRQTFTDAPCAGQIRCSVRTLMPGGDGVYFKQGYYRQNSTVPIGVVYHDGFSVARTEFDLQPL